MTYWRKREKRRIAFSQNMEFELNPRIEYMIIIIFKFSGGVIYE